MTNRKITDLTELSAEPASGDKIPIVDISDTTQAATGTTKFVTKDNLLAGIITAYYESNIANPPTEADLTSALGAPSTDLQGDIYHINDSGNGSNEYLVFCDGANYWFTTLTKATT